MKLSLKEFVEAITEIDKNIGFSKFVKYIFIFCLVLAIFNYKTIIKDTIEIYSEISDKIHSEKMELRDQLLAELKPLLTEFRSNSRADRILYFEYHNSKENLVSIPFKYVELLQQDNGFAVPSIDPERYKSINTGLITSIYEDIKFGEIVYCDGPRDSVFMEKYPGIHELVNSRDGSKRQIFISIPGIVKLLENIDLDKFDTIILDSHGWLWNDEESFEKPKPGLGAHLYEKLGRKNLNIIGIAKSYYCDNNMHTFSCFRGNSKNPLYVDSINQDKDYSEVIKSMYGNFRIPYLIKLADTESKINFK